MASLLQPQAAWKQKQPAKATHTAGREWRVGIGSDKLRQDLLVTSKRQEEGTSPWPVRVLSCCILQCCKETSCKKWELLQSWVPGCCKHIYVNDGRTGFPTNTVTQENLAFLFYGRLIRTSPAHRSIDSLSCQRVVPLDSCTADLIRKHSCNMEE